MPSPGILALNAQEGSDAQGLADNIDEVTGRRKVFNIEQKAENRSDLYNLAGRGISAGISTAKDYQAYQDAKASGADTTGLAGVDANGNFSGGRDFVDSLVKPSDKYQNLRRQQGPQNIKVPDDPQLTQVTSPSPSSQPGPISSIHGDNAPVVGSMINGMLATY